MYKQIIGNLRNENMAEKRPIDRIRKSSGHATIGSIEDGAIIDMKNIGDRLVMFYY